MANLYHWPDTTGPVYEYPLAYRLKWEVAILVKRALWAVATWTERQALILDERIDHDGL